MLGDMVLGFAVAVSAVPASFAQDSQAVDPCKPPGTAIEAEDRQEQRAVGSGSGIFVAIPTGRVCVGPELVDGAPIYVRGTRAQEGMKIVEVSTTPFMPILAPGVVQLAVRPDQPAPW